MVVGPLTVKRPIGKFKNTVAYHHNELYHHPAQNVVICGRSVTDNKGCGSYAVLLWPAMALRPSCAATASFVMMVVN